MFGYIYKTTNKINNKVYIGQHQSEVFEPDKYIGSGTLLCRAIKKYGKEAFMQELLEECNTKEQLNDAEIYWIQYYDSQDTTKGYNIASGGGGGSGPCSESKKQRLREYNKQCTVVNNGVKAFRVPIMDVDKYISEGYSYGYLPYKRSEEFKKKVSATNSAKVCMSKDGIQRRIPKSQVQEFLDNGWQYGWIKTYNPEPKVKHGSGAKRYMFDGNRYELVYESNWDEYKSAGWVFRGPTAGKPKAAPQAPRIVSEETRQKLRDTHLGVKHTQDRVERHREKLAGRKYMHKDGVSKLIPKGEEAQYLATGWQFGKALRK